MPVAGSLPGSSPILSRPSGSRFARAGSGGAHLGYLATHGSCCGKLAFITHGHGRTFGLGILGKDREDVALSNNAAIAVVFVIECIMVLGSSVKQHLH